MRALLLALLFAIVPAWGAFPPESGSVNVPVTVTHVGVFDNSGAPWPLLGTIQAENYDSGGEGTAFHAASNCGNTPVYRTGADWDNITTGGTGFVISCSQTGDWQKTTVSAPAQGTQQFAIAMSIAGVGSTVNFVWEIDACDPTCVQLGTVSVSGGSTTVFSTVQSTTFTLSAGTHVIRRFCQSSTNGFCGDVDFMSGLVPGVPTITAVNVTPTTFTIPVSPPTTIAQLSSTCSGASCAGTTFALGTSGACAGAASANNGNFAISGSNLNVAQAIGGTSVTEQIGVVATLAGATNSGTCFAQTLTGSSGPAIPTEAAAAGFTTLAGNFDFSTSAYADVGGSNSNWFDCFNSNSSLLWHSGSPGVFPINCNIHQKVDALDGSTVMHIHMDVTDNCNSFGFPGCSVSAETRSEYNRFNVTAEFPHMYFETVMRIEGTFAGGPYSYPLAVWMWTDDANGGLSTGTEIDNAECQYDTGGHCNDGSPNWAAGGNPPPGISGWDQQCFIAPCPTVSFDPTKYNKFGVLETSDGSTDIRICWFINDTLQKCGSVPSVFAFQYTQRHFLIMTVYAAGFGPTPVNKDMDVKYIRIWSCSSWTPTNGSSTGMCNGSALFNDGTLAYWH